MGKILDWKKIESNRKRQFAGSSFVPDKRTNEEKYPNYEAKLYPAFYGMNVTVLCCVIFFVSIPTR